MMSYDTTNWGFDMEDWRDDWEDAREKWVDKHVEEYLEEIKGYIKYEEFLNDFAIALAWNFHENSECGVFESSNLTYDHCVCYLYHMLGSDCYEDEVDDAFRKSMEETD